MVERAKAELSEQIIEVLCEFISRVDAHTMLARSMRSAGVTGPKVSESDLGAVLQKVEVNVSLLVPPERRATLRERLASLKGTNSQPVSSVGREVIPVRSENDIVVARTRARILCEALKVKSVSAHKVATVVSELARNIVSYTPGGTIELTPSQSPLQMTIKSVDQGEGIKNLDAIMSGNYRSKTGLGLGLAGSKRLASHFEINTGPQGTTILVVMKL